MRLLFFGDMASTGFGTVTNDPDPAFDDCSDNSHTSANALAEMQGQNIGDLLNKKNITWGWFQGGFTPATAWALAVLTERDITGRRRAHRPARPRQRDARGFFDDLKEGDYVVHHQHGVARYGGMVRRAIAGHDRDYLVLEYRSGDRLYVPSDQIDVVRHYTGGDSPSLSRLNGSDWQKTKARVRSAVAEIAQELGGL